MPHLLDIQNIHLKFNQKEILSDFNLSVDQGDKILISGISGSGKTSIFKLILGFIKAESGSILFKGIKADAQCIQKIRQLTAYIPQDLDFADGNVQAFLDQMLQIKANRSIGKPNPLPLFQEFLLDPDILNKNIEELSGGEKQRLALITGLLLQKELYLLDEPGSALDHEARLRVITHFANFDKTLIVAAHDPDWLSISFTKHYELKNGSEWEHTI